MNKLDENGKVFLRVKSELYLRFELNIIITLLLTDRRPRWTRRSWNQMQIQPEMQNSRTSMQG